MSNTPLVDFAVDKANKTVHITRIFNAGIDLVWQAWTTPELLDQWWAPKPFASRTKVMNFEVGGRRFYAMVSPEGMERWVLQTYTSISPKTNFKMLNVFTDADGKPDPHGSDWDLTFNEQNSTTKVSIIIKNDSLERMEKMIEMGFKEGFAMTMQQMDDLLPTWAGK